MQPFSRAVVIFLIIFLTEQGFAQTDKEVRASRLSTPPTIDGVVDPGWLAIEPSGNFVQFEPRNGDQASVRTKFRIGFDQAAIYFLVECDDPDPAAIAAAATSRDGDLENDDAVLILLDTFADNNSGYLFSTNLIGTQYDGRVTDNGRSNDTQWDGTWQCAAAPAKGGWIAEFRIPFSTIRFASGEDVVWKINLIRSYPRNREISTWAGPVEEPFRVSEAGKLLSLQIQPQEEKRYELIPYVMAQVQEGASTKSEIGLDASYRIKNDLSVQLAFNPDFALIEADVEQINLSRFELYVPEKRPFFQEGSELFSQRINQFYSRRIGDIPWGGKLNGRVAGWDTAAIIASSSPVNARQKDQEANYFIARGKRQLFQGSNIGFMVANRSWQGEDTGSIGLDTTLFFTETLGMTAQLIRAHGAENDGALAWFVRPSFDSSTTHFHIRYTNLDKGLLKNMNTVGFLRDDDRREIDTNFTHTFWFENFLIENIELSNNYNRYWSQADILRSWEYDGSAEIAMRNKWFAELKINEEYKLYEKEFRNHEYGMEVGYDTRAGRSFAVEYARGRSFGSDFWLLEAKVEAKIVDGWNIEYGLTRLWLDPDPDTETTWIHVVRTSYFFDKDFFLRAFLQSNSSISKEAAQVVMVWRFMPPFGSLQTAWQYGSQNLGVNEKQGHSLFVKLSWVF